MPHGQNHDRMETDDESDDSESEPDSGTDTPEQSETTTEPVLQPSAPGPEAMDTTPDDSPVPVEPSNLQPPTMAASQDLSQLNSTTVRIGVTANIGMNPSGFATLVDQPSLSFNMNGVDQPTGEIRVTIPNAALENSHENRNPPPPQREDSIDSRTRRERRAEQRDRDDEQDRNDDSDDSSDDEENPYWASFKEDTSTPDDRELKIIEESEKSLPTATDHEHWETNTFEPLDDPEYIPADIGRISWTLKGVHGTPEKPNKDRIIRSPSVRIGDFNWNIKYYPRGNDGTEQVSVYVECSPTSHEQIFPTEKEKEGRSGADIPGAGGPVNDTSGEHNQILPDATSLTEPHTAAQSDTQSVTDPSAPIQAPQPTSEELNSETEKPWRVAAQVCCVLYNPNEPRVYATQRSYHSYYNDNPDWGWTRFHGPWDELHQRKRYQRQALLRNDTLAFTVYLRIVKDETQALWWHPPKEKPNWNSLEMTGVRGFRCARPEQPNAIIAAFSAWLHLNPFLRLIKSPHIPDGFSEPDVRPKSIIEQLRSLIDEVGDYSDLQRDIPLSLISTLIELSNSDGLRKLDVVGFWEHLRRLLTVEYANVASVEETCNTEVEAFKEILVLKQPDPFDLDSQSQIYHPLNQDSDPLSPDYEPRSVQEAVNLASQHPKKGFRVWECYPQQRQDPPTHPQVLQIELHRQHFDQMERKWMKLGHRIALSELIMFSGESYSLYGMIVHSGSLESQEYYTVIRPRGPGTRWVKYAGDSSTRKVSILTTKQAITAHEGSGEPIMEKKHADRKKENAAVAYVAMYIRSDVLYEVLATPFDRKTLDAQKKARDSKASASTELAISSEPSPSMQRTPVQVPVYFYWGDAFSGVNDLDLFDPWSVKLREQCHDVCRIILPENTVIREIKELLEFLLAQTEIQDAKKSFKLWLLDTRKPALGALPAFYGYARNENDPLEVVPLFSEGCRFWIGGQKLEVIRTIIQQLRNSNLEQLLKDLRDRAKAQAEQANQKENQPNAAESVEADTADIVIEDSNSREEGELPDSGDTVMSDAQDGENEPPPPSVPATAETQARGNTNELEERQVLCFAKLFDWESQTMQSVTSFSAPMTANVVYEVKKALDVDQKPAQTQQSEDAMDQSEQSENVQSEEQPQQQVEEGWDVYHVCFQFAKAQDMVSPTATFENHILSTSLLPDDFQIIIPSDGACFIAQRRPKPDQYVVTNSLPLAEAIELANSALRLTALEAAGKPTCVPQFIYHLLACKYNPTYVLPYRTTSYFGSNYFSGSQSFARPHGQGTLVTMAGDAYTGPFASGKKSGSGGKMVFANKDVYEGDWEADEPHGEGKMVYSTTKNVYTGGWKKGKRHGRGRMEYEVADEQMKLCQVCYEEEMDSLFYACGHVCACEACAKQVESCPVCRERVRGVVKVRWTV